ncbi:MAG: hypothetical protein AAF502_02680 [Bacteroidota bacterium]
MNTTKTVNDSKLVLMLKTLSKREISRFEAYLNASFFKHQEIAIRLFELLKNEYPQFSNVIDKRVLYSQLFSEVPVGGKSGLTSEEDKSLRYGMNHLTSALQEFFIHEDLQQKSIRKRNMLARIYLNRGLYKFVPGLLKKLKQSEERQEFKDPDHYYECYRTEETGFFYNLLTNNRSKRVGIQEVLEHFHEYYLANQLRYFCAAINRENILRVSYDYPMMDELLLHLGQKEYPDVPLIDVYHNILLLLKNTDSDIQYQKLKSLLIKYQGVFSPEENQQMNAFALNFCNARIKSGESQYRNEKHDIYLSTLSGKVWFIGKFFHPHHFVLIIKNALVLGEAEWVAEFIDAHAEHLPPAYRTSIPFLGRAYLAFYSNNYDLAHEYLLKIGSPEDFFYELYYRIFLIQLYYEQSLAETSEHFESLIFNALEAFRFYISPTRSGAMSENNRLAYANFVRLAKRLYRLRFPQWIDKFSEQQTERLKADIEKAEYLEEREWLLEKANEIVASLQQL